PDTAERQHGEREHDSTGKRAMREERLVAIEDFQEEPDMMPVLIEAGIESTIAAPVRVSGEVAGAIIVASRERGRRFTEPEREALLAYADHAGLALTDARLSDQVKRALHDPLTGLPNRSLLSEQL